MTEKSETAKLKKRNSSQIRAARYAFALAIVVCLAVGVYLTIEDKTSSLAVKLSGLGINLIAAAAFSTIFALLVERENRSLVEHQLDERFDAHTSKLLAAVSNLNSAYLPTAVYAPGQGYNQTFNRNLMDDLNHSSYYYFRGPSAKYIAARLKALRRRPDLVRVYIPSPDSIASIKFDIANRSRTRRETIADISALYEQFRDDTLSAIIGLFDSRAYGRIEIFFCDDTLISRYEATEQRLYVSWYTSLENASGSKFPETTEFPRTSHHYQATMIDMERRASFASHSLFIGPDLDRSKFKLQLESIFGKAYDDDQIAQLAHTYWKERADFLTFLGSL